MHPLNVMYVTRGHTRPVSRTHAHYVLPGKYPLQVLVHAPSVVLENIAKVMARPHVPIVLVTNFRPRRRLGASFVSESITIRLKASAWSVPPALSAIKMARRPKRSWSFHQDTGASVPTRLTFALVPFFKRVWVPKTSQTTEMATATRVTLGLSVLSVTQMATILALMLRNAKLVPKKRQAT